MPPAPTAPGVIFPGRRRVLMTACLGAFMSTLDTSIVNIALPQIAQDLQGSVVQVSWVVVVYLLINASLLLTCGRLGDLLAPGRLYFLGLLVFTGASVLCGLSPRLSWLVASRALQGLGASLILALAPKLIALSYGEGERGLALGLFSTAFATGVSLGAPLGGMITTYCGWPYIFFINIPFCGLALMVGRRSLVGLSAGAAWDWKALDRWGSLILAGCLGALLLALNRLQNTGWGDHWTLGTIGLAMGLFGLLLLVERRQPFPLLHLKLWRKWSFIQGSVGALLASASVLGAFFLLPFFLEQIYRYSPDQAGLLLAILSVTSALVSPLGGHLADRWGNTIILRTSTALILVGLGSLVFTGAAASTLGLSGRLAIIGLGFGLFHAPNLNEVLRDMPPSLVGLAASTITMLKNLGALLGITIVATALTCLPPHQLRPGPEVCLGINSFHLAFNTVCLLGGITLIIYLVSRGKL